MFCLNHIEAIIWNNTFDSNQAAEGGALHINVGSMNYVGDNIFKDNVARKNGGGCLID